MALVLDTAWWDTASTDIKAKLIRASLLGSHNGERPSMGRTSNSGLLGIEQALRDFRAHNPASTDIKMARSNVTPIKASR